MQGLAKLRQRVTMQEAKAKRGGDTTHTTMNMPKAWPKQDTPCLRVDETEVAYTIKGQSPTLERFVSQVKVRGVRRADHPTYKVFFTEMEKRGFDISRKPLLILFNVVVPTGIVDSRRRNQLSQNCMPLELVANLGGGNYTYTHMDVGGGPSFAIALGKPGALLKVWYCWDSNGSRPGGYGQTTPLRRGHTQEVHLSDGQTIVAPACKWHAVESPGPSLLIGCMGYPTDDLGTYVQSFRASRDNYEALAMEDMKYLSKHFKVY
jgi:hypothetical protein